MLELQIMKIFLLLLVKRTESQVQRLMQREDGLAALWEEDGGGGWFQHWPFTQKGRKHHAHLYLNETRLFVETRSVTQIGKCVLSEQVCTPTRNKHRQNRTHTNREAMSSLLHSSDTLRPFQACH